MLLTLVTERMIGVELIHTLQTVLFSMAYMETCPATLAPLQSLTYANGYNRMIPRDYARLYQCKHSIVQVGLVENEFLLNFNIMYLVLGIIIAVQVILKLIMMKFQKDL